MSKQNHEHILNLPINDMGDLLAHMKKWGEFSIDKDSRIGGVDQSEVVGIILDWLSACDVALTGQELVERALKEHSFRSDYKTIKIYNEFAAALGNPGLNETKLLIEGARRAFRALKHPELKSELRPEDIEAAQRLVTGFDRIHRRQLMDIR